MNDEEKKGLVERDQKYISDMMYRLSETGLEAVEEMLEVAKSTEHPRAYEVLATLMKNTADISEKLLDGHKRVKDILKQEDPGAGALPPPTSDETTTVAFVGNGVDLLRFLQDQDKKEEKEVQGEVIEHGEESDSDVSGEH